MLSCCIRCSMYIKMSSQERVQYAKKTKVMAEGKMSTCAHLALRSLWLPTR